MATPDERAPLLEACHNNNNNNNTSVPTRSLVHRICYPTVAQRASVTIFLGIFMLELATNASMPALNSIIETLVCREIYAYDGGGGGGSGTADPRCKAPDVVARFTSVRSTMTALDCIPAIVLALPYGILADHVGRRPVVIMAWAGYALQMAWYLVALGGTRLGLLELSGLLVAAPVMYSALQRGQAWGGLWTGLPFLVAASMIFVGLLIISVFRLPADKLRADDAEATESAEAEV